jgi:hypothetical protein
MNASCSKKATLLVCKRQPAAVPNMQQIVNVVVGGPLQDEIFQSSPHVITQGHILTDLLFVICFPHRYII